MGKKFKLRGVLKPLLVFAVLFIILFLSCGLFIKNKFSDIGFVKSLIYKNTGLVLNSDNINTSFSGLSFIFYSPYISISAPDNSKPFIEAKEIMFGVKILPLLKRKIAIYDVSSDGVSLSFSRLNDGSFDILKYINFQKKSFFKADLSLLNMNLADYNVSFNDNLLKYKLSVRGNYLTSNGLNPDKNFVIDTSGVIESSFDGKKAVSPYNINLDFLSSRKSYKFNNTKILIANFDTSFLSSYLKKYGVNSTEALIDIFVSSDDDGSQKIVVSLDKINIDFIYKNDKNTIKSSSPLLFDCKCAYFDKALKIDYGRILSDGIDINFTGKVLNPFMLESIEPVLDIKINDTKLSSLLKISPDTIIPFQVPYVKNLKLYNANAVINGGAKVDFKNIDDFSVKGKLKFDDVYLVKRPNNAKTSFGECEFDGRNVFISVFAYAPNDALLTVFGKTKMQKMPYAEFSVKSYKPLDMHFAQGILIPLQQILALKLGPIPYMDLAGLGEIVLKTKGTKEKAELFGEFKTNNATVSLNGLNAVLTDGSVNIKFQGSDIIYKGATGLINGARTKIDGTADTSGNLNVDVFVDDITSTYAMHTAKTSDIVKTALNGAKFLDAFEPNKGTVDFYLNLSGNVPPNAAFNQTTDSILAKGKIVFNGVGVNVEPKIKGENLTGVLTFENNAKFDLNADIFNSPFNIKGEVNPEISDGKVAADLPSSLNITFSSNNIKSASVGQFLKDNIELFIPENRNFTLFLSKMFLNNTFLLKGSVNAKGLVDPDSDVLDLSGFDFSGEIDGQNRKNSDFYFKDGKIVLRNKNALFEKLKINASGIDFLMDGSINKFASNKPDNNLKLEFYKSSFLNYVNFISKILPEKQASIMKNFTDFKGEVYGKIKLYKDKIDGNFTPYRVSFKDIKNNILISLSDGEIKLKDDKTYFNAFNLLYGDIPVYFDGFVQTQGSNPEFNIFASTNLSEAACDKLINPHLQYPLLLTGEATVKGRIKGRMNSYLTYLTLVLNEGSDLSFMGLKLGDVRQKREISSKIRFASDSAYIDYIRYFKYILSQNNRETPYDLINVKGSARLHKGSLVLNNLKFITPNPAPVRFLNIMFKKSLIKDGLFTSNLVLNGPVNNFKATGDIKFSNVMVPMYNSVIDNITMNLKQDSGVADFSLFSYGTKADVSLNFENKFTLPLVINDIKVSSDSISMDNLMNAFSNLADSANKFNSSLSVSGAQNSLIAPSDILVKKGSVNVDKVIINGVEANDLKLDFSHSQDTSLKIDNASINMAGGTIKGSGVYKFDTRDVSVTSDVINCDANELSKAFFRVDGQIYGHANGNVKLSINDFSSSDYVKKINADADFEIIKGRLPKLGSIEYLLRASNFFKSGIFGMTLNNVIDLLTPYKHGDFNRITGYFTVGDAMIKGLKLYSQGDNLSTYTYGSYDILNGTADIEILGKLSKKVSSLLGPVGNASVVSILNTLTRNKVDELVKTEMLKDINKVPLMDLNNDDFRLFNAKIEGEINADNIVKSFNWLN